MPRTVLIVDDHPSFRATARMLLEADGWSVVGEAADGQGGLEAAAALLPDLDGFAVAARLTGDDGAPAVVLVSSRDARDFGPLVTRSGARGFVSKADLSGQALRGLVG